MKSVRVLVPIALLALGLLPSLAVLAAVCLVLGLALGTVTRHSLGALAALSPRSAKATAD